MGFQLESPMPRTRRVRVVGSPVFALLVVAVVGAGFAGYRSTRPILAPAVEPRRAADVVVLVETEPYEGFVPSNAHHGTLVVLKGGCLGLTDGSVLVLPLGTRATASSGEVVVNVPTGFYDPAAPTVALRPGDEVQFGARFLEPVPPREYDGPLNRHVPRACRDYPVQDLIEPMPE